MQPALPRTRVASAFTLIELLVVVAIIVIIMGIAIPSLNSISKSGEFTQVASQFNTLFATAYAAALGSEASTQSRPASGILFMRARPGNDKRQGALENQRALPVVFKPYDERDPASGAQMDDPSAIGDRPAGYTSMTYANYFEYHPYFRPIEDVPAVDLPENVWVAPDFFDEPGNRNVSGISVAIPDAEYFDGLLRRTRPPVDDSRLDRFMITFAPGGETLEKQTICSTNGNDIRNQLVFRPSPTSRWQTTPISNDWVTTRNPVSARGVIVYDRETMLKEAQGADRRDYVAQTGRPLYLSRYGGQTIFGEGF